MGQETKTEGSGENEKIKDFRNKCAALKKRLVICAALPKASRERMNEYAAILTDRHVLEDLAEEILRPCIRTEPTVMKVVDYRFNFDTWHGQLGEFEGMTAALCYTSQYKQLPPMPELTKTDLLIDAISKMGLSRIRINQSVVDHSVVGDATKKSTTFVSNDRS